MTPAMRPGAEGPSRCRREEVDGSTEFRQRKVHRDFVPLRAGTFSANDVTFLAMAPCMRGMQARPSQQDSSFDADRHPNDSLARHGESTYTPNPPYNCGMRIAMATTLICLSLVTRASAEPVAPSDADRSKGGIVDPFANEVPAEPTEAPEATKKASSKMQGKPAVAISSTRAAFYGSAAGLANGVLLLFPMIDSSKPCDDCNGTEIGPPDGLVGSALLGATAGAIGGYAWARNARATAGQVTLTATLGFAGLWTSELLYVSAVGAADDGGKANAIVIGLGLDLGLVAGAYLSRDLDWSASRAHLVAAGGGLGTLGGMLLGRAVGADRVCSGNSCSAGPVLFGAMLGGLWLGIGGAIILTEEMEPGSGFAPRTGTQALRITPLVSSDATGLSIGADF